VERNERMKILNSKIVLMSGRCRDGMIKEEIFDQNGKKLKPYKREEQKNPRPHTLFYYKLNHGTYQIKKNVALRNGQQGTLYQTLEVLEDGVKIIMEKCKGNLTIEYLRDISVP
jgi:PAB1-binding protein PBP1